MRTKLKSIHNEEYSDNSKTLGVLLNYSLEDENWKDTLIFIYNHERATYMFFTTIVDMIDFLLYGTGSKLKSAYMKEEEFDTLYDAEYIDGKFSEKLTWL